LDCLGDKGHFDGYLRKLGLSKYAPVSYKSLEEAAYPCLIKRTNLAASSGQELADSKAAAERILESDGFRGHRVILQNLIVHSDEFVTHGVAVDGRILWHTSFVYHIEDGATLLRAGVSNWMEKVATPPAWLELFEKMLSPLRYDGPFNVNHIEMPDGHTVVLEINPRFGGSLMRSTSAKELHESLTCILKHARRRA
jgi:carbamoylphosphate synthase large subunit